MLIRTAAVVAVSALAGTAVGVPAATAAPIRCAIGVWRLTGATLTVDSTTARLRFSGGAGALLRLDGRNAVHSYGSSHSFAETGTSNGRPVVGRLWYRKTLRLRTAISGTKVLGRISSATGPATLKIRQTRPLYYDPSPQRLVTLLRNGEFSGVPYQAAYSCGSSTLRLRQKVVAPGRILNGHWTYRRI